MPESGGRIVVVGAGIAGLAAALRLRRHDPSLDVDVLEATARPGGGVAEVAVGDLRLPAGPEALYARRPAGVELCRELGIDLMKPAASGMWLWTDRGLVEYPSHAPFGIPSELGDVFRWPGVSRRGRRRALGDLVRRKRRSGEDGSIGSLLRRRLGDEATDRAIAPLLSDPFGGAVDRLSVRATFPELPAWEASQGSLLRGSMATMRDARRAELGPLRLRPEGGVEVMVERAAAELGPALRTGARVEAIVPDGAGWSVRIEGTAPVRTDAVVLSVAADGVRRVLGPAGAVAGADLATIPNVSRGVVLLVYPAGTAERLPYGSGFVVPAGAAPMTACSWFSSVWPSPAFGTRAVLRCTIGGDGQEEVLGGDDADIFEACARHLAAMLPLPEVPQHAEVVRRPHAAPQYLVGHVERVARIRDALPAGIFVAGKSFDGVDVASCVASAGTAAEQAATFVRSIDRETTR